MKLPDLAADTKKYFARLRDFYCELNVETMGMSMKLYPDAYDIFGKVKVQRFFIIVHPVVTSEVISPSKYETNYPKSILDKFGSILLN